MVKNRAPIEYSSASTNTTKKVCGLAIVALVMSVLGSPLVKMVGGTRPFWTGHPLARLQLMIMALPSAALTVGGVALAILALYQIRMRRQHLDGAVYAWAAVAVGALALLMYCCAWLMFAFGGPLAK